MTSPKPDPLHPPTGPRAGTGQEPTVIEAGGRRGDTCGDKHHFKRDAVAQVAAAHVTCTKPAGHDGGHQAIRGRTAFCWRAVTEALVEESTWTAPLTDRRLVGGGAP